MMQYDFDFEKVKSVQIFPQCEGHSFLLEIFFFTAVPGIQNQYILCDETNSSSINDSKRDVAPKWVDLPFSASPHCSKSIMAAFG